MPLIVNSLTVLPYILYNVTDVSASHPVKSTSVRIGLPDESYPVICCIGIVILKVLPLTTLVGFNVFVISAISFIF